jgi:hypothetical protein
LANCSAKFVAISDHNYDFVVLAAQGRVILCLFAPPPCKHSSIEALGSGGAKANVNHKYSIFGGVVPRFAEFRGIACEINSLGKVSVQLGSRSNERGGEPATARAPVTRLEEIEKRR